MFKLISTDNPTCGYKMPSFLKASLPFLFVFTLAGMIAAPVVAQEEEDGAENSLSPESTAIEPYTGPPIYLKEIETPPDAKQVEKTSVTIYHDQNKDKTKPMFEREIAKYSDNSYKSDGPYKEFFTNGQVFVEGTYDDGRPTGKWTYYHENGKVAKEVEYVKGKPTGEISIYNAEGKILSKRTYKDGLRNGIWVTYSKESDQTIVEQAYSEGKPDGVWKIWFENGQIRREISFKAGKQDGITKEWNNEGKLRAEANYKEGKQHGMTTVWRRDGKVIKQTYDQGKFIKQDIEESDSAEG